MNRTIRHQLLFARIAIFAILMSALMPVIGQALMRANDASQWTEICTAGGVVLVDLGADEGAAVPRQQDGQRVACPFCLPHAVHAALAPEPPLSVVAVVVDPRTDFPPPPPLSARRTAWLTAFSRGPPNRS
ncbi:DUF2946 domain-containing protein [Azoarcus sp. L1K30]|uniref:DUF2946 domain-containing protein n=1 Tax=Azoarcus sp. L1K30 TaxID=2820277 RepID=UPI001B83AB70|nr:DUF2946 domain-containing protein [Azoarcus sp. L1K30]MBR0564942.1 DUF2946 domain-containing protein [Azoarcus sp. L1K30]